MTVARTARPNTSTSCGPIVPALARVADGEASPREAMLAARHVSDCTACRITLAREVRLAAMLEQGLDDPLQVGEDFVRAVMDSLPQGPPPPRQRSARGLPALGGLLRVRSSGSV
jgi:anti-sigma factor RsiW